MSKVMTLCLAVLITFSFSSIAAAAKQCIKNDAAVVLNVTWYNASGKKDKNASNSSLSQGYQACQDNKNIGFAKINCNACESALSKKFMIYDGGVAWGVPSLDRKDRLIAGLKRVGAKDDIVSVIERLDFDKIKNALIVVPTKGKTVTCKGSKIGSVGCPFVDSGKYDKLEESMKIMR